MRSSIDVQPANIFFRGFYKPGPSDIVCFHVRDVGGPGRRQTGEPVRDDSSGGRRLRQAFVAANTTSPRARRSVPPPPPSVSVTSARTATDKRRAASLGLITALGGFVIAVRSRKGDVMKRSWLPLVLGTVIWLLAPPKRDERGLSQSSENAILLAGAVAVALLVVSVIRGYVRARLPK